MMTRIRNILKSPIWIWNDPEGPVLPSRLPPFVGIWAGIKADLKQDKQDDVLVGGFTPEADYDFKVCRKEIAAYKKRLADAR